MFSFNKKPTNFDIETFEKYEYAKDRVIQKKRLFQHFIIFLMSCCFFSVLNLFLQIGQHFYIIGLRWFVAISLIWGFVFLVHLCNVWLFSKFMGSDWEKKHTRKLIEKQNRKIQKIEDKLAKDLKKKRPEIAELLEEQDKQEDKKKDKTLDHQSTNNIEDSEDLIKTSTE